MKQQGLQPSVRIVESDWLVSRLRFFGSGVAGVVPDGFSAYVRILHPARCATNNDPVSWAQVAAWSGCSMHRLVQFHRIAESLPSYGIGPKPWDGQSPEPGNLPIDLLRVLCATLGEHTRTGNSCWFCLWDGYGWLHGSTASAMAKGRRPAPSLNVLDGASKIPYDVQNVPRVHLPHRDYLLFEGPLSAATELGWSPSSDVFFSKSPNLFWPQDHAWCVASEIDLFCTLVGGSEALAEALLANSSLEAWRVDPGDPVTYDSDRINV